MAGPYASVAATPRAGTPAAEVRLDRRVYYAHSALTLGLPQGVRLFRAALRRCAEVADTCDEPDMAACGSALEILATGALVAAQVGAMGYGYYLVAEKIFR